jgi:RNA recognition motif-containing protein
VIVIGIRDESGACRTLKRRRNMKLYVGNLSFDTTDEQLRAAFAAHGQVSSVDLIMDRDTGRPRGFGFVEMANETEAKAAISALDGSAMQGRTITVNQARDRNDRSSGGGGGYQRGGSGGGRGGGGGGGYRSW